MKRGLFKANFLQSSKITYNLFKKRPAWYDLGAAGSQKIGLRFLKIGSFSIFMIWSYGFGVFLPEVTPTFYNNFDDIRSAAQFFTFLKWPIVIGIILVMTINIVDLIPKPNYLVTRIFEISYGMLFIFISIIAVMPFMLHLTLGAAGWVGFSIICIYGTVFVLKVLISTVQKMKQQMYEDDNIH